MVASTFSTIGLPVASDVELDALAQRLHQLAERVHAPNGEYFRWSDPSGAEAWLQVNAAKELIGINPHFAGRSTIQVGLTARLARPGYELDGSFHGWADPAGDAPDSFSMRQNSACTKNCRFRRERKFRLQRSLTRSLRSRL